MQIIFGEMMGKKSRMTLLILTSLVFFGCPDENSPIIIPPTPTNCVYPAGNRNITWRVDTVAWFPSFLGGVHSFSDSDAYLMGYIGEGKPPYRIFVGKHWNGTTWDTNINGTDAEVAHVANDVTGDDHFMVSVGNWSFTPPKPALGEFDNRTKKWKGYQFQTQGELRSIWTDSKGYFIAVGDNGMVYTKDGYTSEWVYQKAPTDFNFYKMSGVSKSEIYVLGYKSMGGITYPQIWKYDGIKWLKFLDEIDTSGTILKIPGANILLEIYTLRDAISLIRFGYIFLDGNQMYLKQKVHLSNLKKQISTIMAYHYAILEGRPKGYLDFLLTTIGFLEQDTIIITGMG